MKQTFRLLVLCVLGFAAALQAQTQTPTLVMASTTSTDQSGLFGHLLPAFKAATGIDVKVVALGTGQALDMGRRGDADVLFVHDQVAEEKFVADGFGLKRMPVMYNDFVLVGPAKDAAKTQGKDIAFALKQVAATKASFISRGDKSGTHAAELRYWTQAGVGADKGRGPIPSDGHLQAGGDEAQGLEGAALGRVEEFHANLFAIRFGKGEIRCRVI